MPPIRTDNDPELDKLFTAIANDMATASIHWLLCVRLCESVAEYLHEFNTANCFWRLTIDAHRDVALWRIGRLYDKTKGALSLPNFLATLMQKESAFEESAFRARLASNPHVDSLASHDRRPSMQQLQADLARVTTQDPLVQDLVTFRNKHIGHRDADAALGRLQVPGLAQESIAELMDRARDIVNHYSSLYRASTQSVEMIGADDYKFLLRASRLAIESQEAAREKRDGGAAATE